MSTMRCTFAAAGLALLLASCAGGPARPPAAPLDPLAARQATAAREALSDWALSGRVAISNAGRGGNARIDWTQRGERYDIALSAPVTRQSWRLAGDAAGARLDGVEGGPRESADVENLLLAATGWDIPVRAMVAWVRGVPAPTAGEGGVALQSAADGLPARLVQDGWEIDYREWLPVEGARPALPRRIEARRGEARVRLLVDDWVVSAPEAGAGAGDDAPRAADELLAQALGALSLDDPAADLRARVAAGDLRPVAVCGFACLAPGYGPQGGDMTAPADARILDGSGDAVMGERHLQLKARAEAYARAYNRALAAWRDARGDSAGP